MAYLKADQMAVDQMKNNGAISIVADDSNLHWYDDLLADVRHDSKYHSIRGLVQPFDPEVMEVAQVLVQAPDFIAAAQEFVDSFTTYRAEVGDFWQIPVETLSARAGDCDDKAILLCSLLLVYLPPEEVYCGFGLWKVGGKATGHMFVVTQGVDGEDRIIEATAGPEKPGKGKYIIHAIFNHKYTFATDVGVCEFNLKPVETAEGAARR